MIAVTVWCMMKMTVKLSYGAFATNGSPASQTSRLAEYSELLSYTGEMEEWLGE